MSALGKISGILTFLDEVGKLIAKSENEVRLEAARVLKKKLAVINKEKLTNESKTQAEKWVSSRAFFWLCEQARECPCEKRHEFRLALKNSASLPAGEKKYLTEKIRAAGGAK